MAAFLTENAFSLLSQSQKRIMKVFLYKKHCKGTRVLA